MNQINGVHCIIELFGCPFGLLNDEGFIRETISAAAVESGSTLISISSHQFSPQGVTALGLLAESHISIHTWPEVGYAAADVFTCGSHCVPQQASQYLANTLQAGRHVLSVLNRGSQIPCNITAFLKQKGGEDTCIRSIFNPPFG